MKLSEVYQEELARAAMWERLREGKTPQVSMRFNEETWDCAETAENIAHCIAMFGDLDLAALDVEALWWQSEDQYFPGKNPWTRGLTYLKNRVARQAEEASRSLCSASSNDTVVSNVHAPLLVVT